MEKVNMITFGIVGLGHVSKWHLKAINKLENVILKGVCDIDIEKINAKRWHIPACTKLDEFLAIKKIDTVIVAVPPAEQYAVARQCLEAGKNVLLEKPGTQSHQELEKLFNIADGLGRRLVIALHASYGREVKAFTLQYRVFDKERLGPLTGFNSNFLDPYIVNGKVLPQAQPLGGSWLDSGVNALSIIEQFIPLE